MSMRPLLVSGGVALGLRALYLATTNNPFWTHLGLDMRGYHDWANAVLSGRGLGPAPFTQAPFFPLDLAFWYALFGPRPSVGLWSHLLPGTAAVLLVAWAAGRWRGARAAWIAGLLLATYPPAVFYTGVLLPPTWATAWSATILAAGLVAVLQGGRRPAIAAGLAGGLATITQPLLAVLMLPLGASMAGTAKARPHLPWLVGAFLLLPSATLVYNGVAGSSWSLVSVNGGVNLYIGNGPEATGGYIPPVGLRESDDLLGIEAARQRMIAAGDATTETVVGAGEANGYWWRSAWSEMAAHPGRTLRLLGRKLLFTFGAYEVPQVESFPFERRFSPLLRWPGWTLAWLVGAAMLGGMLCWRERAARWLIVSVVAVALALSMFFVTARFRLPLVPWLVVLGAAGVDAAVEAWRSRTRASAHRRPPAVVFAALAIALTAGVLSSIDWVGVRAEASAGQYHFRLGVIAEGEGRISEAIEHYQEAVASDSTQARAQLNLGTLLARAGNLVGARPHLESAARLDPASATAQQNLGQLLQVTGHPERALAAFLQAIERSPELVSARESAAYVLWELGRIPESRQHLLVIYRQATDGTPPKLRSGRLLALVDERRTIAEAHRDEAAVQREWWTSPNLLRADLLLSQGKMAEAVRAYDEAADDPAVAPYARDVARQLREALNLPSTPAASPPPGSSARP